MNSRLKLPQFLSPMKDTSNLRPTGKGLKKKTVAGVMLTSLVDAFTIVVIYLIVSSTGAESMDVKDGIKLPQASHSKGLENAPVVVYKGNNFWIEDQQVLESDLKSRLEILIQKHTGLFKTGESAIIVQADEREDFNKLQPILVASSYAGIRHVKFAVMQKD